MVRTTRRGSAGTWIVVAVGVLGLAGLMAFGLARSFGSDRWLHTVDDGLAVAAADGKSVVVFFTADWCGPCRVFKKRVLTDPEVDAALGEFACVKIDLTERTAPAARIATDLGVNTIPAFHVYGEDGYRKSIYKGAPEPGPFLAWLDRN